jgi:hypothetical protein
MEMAFNFHHTITFVLFKKTDFYLVKLWGHK